MSSTGRRFLTFVAMAAALSACLIAPFGGKLDPSQIPSGEPNVPEAIGPVDVIAQGQDHGIGWRYYVFEMPGGWCTGMDFGDGSSSITCGGLAHGHGAVFRTVGSINRTFEGVVDEEVSEVTLETADGGQFPGTLLPLQRPGLDGSAFVVSYPDGLEPENLVATDENGEVIEEFDVREMAANHLQPPETTSSD